MGFNPTDDGWLQAVARRLLDGEVPHRDFISVRPVLSALLQAPLVWLGGDHVFLLARLWGWLEIGAIAWWWSGLLLPLGRVAWTRLAVYACIFFLNAHVFPVMAWHSLDGLLLGSAALVLARRDTVGSWRAAFLCGGLAVLCRQNFVFFLPFLALGLPGWRAWPHTLWAALPPALYVALLAVHGAVPDFFAQFYAAPGVLRQTAFAPFAGRPGLLWALAGGLAAAGFLRLTLGRFTVLPAFLTLAAALGSAAQLSRGILPTLELSFLLFGAAAGLLLGLLLARKLSREDRFVLVAGLGLAWTVSISIGYNCPALLGGLLLLLIARSLALLADRPLFGDAPGRAVLGVMLAALAFAFASARTHYPYLDRPAGELTGDAGEVVRGASGLRTNPTTYAVLQDLRDLTSRCEAQGTRYAVLTDFSAIWVRSRQPNPLPCEWPQATELGNNEELILGFVRRMCALPAGTVIIVQRYLIAAVTAGLPPVEIAPDYYAIQQWLRAHGRKIDASPFFELYEPPRLKPPEPARDAR